MKFMIRCDIEGVTGVTTYEQAESSEFGRAMLMVGFHARSGVQGALLPHSYSRKNLDIKLNGVTVGEIGMEATIAGDCGVPTWLITGDSAGMAEAQAIIPNVQTVTVKEAMGEFQARCYPPDLTAKWIFETARKIVETPPAVKPLKFESPVTMEIRIAQSDYLTKLRSKYSTLFTKEDILAHFNLNRNDDKL